MLQHGTEIDPQTSFPILIPSTPTCHNIEHGYKFVRPIPTTTQKQPKPKNQTFPQSKDGMGQPCKQLSHKKRKETTTTNLVYQSNRNANNQKILSLSGGSLSKETTSSNPTSLTKPKSHSTIGNLRTILSKETLTKVSKHYLPRNLLSRTLP